MDGNIRLTLLNGPLAGRELMLPQGELSLGGGESDLLVPLENGIEKIVLFIEENRVIVRGGVPCWVDGHAVQYTEEGRLGFVLPENRVVDLLGQGLLLSTGDTSEGNMKVPARIPDLTVPPRLSVLERLRQRANGLSRWWIGGLLVLTLAVAVGFGALYWGGSGREGGPADQDSLRRLQAWLAVQQENPALSDLKFSWQSSHEVWVEGRIRSSQDLKPILWQLRREHILVREKMACDDQLVNNVSYILKLYGFDAVSVRPGRELGSVEIVGRVRGDTRWQKVVNLLTTMPGLHEWRVTNPSGAQMQELVAKLTEIGLLHKLNIAESKNKFLLTGLLNTVEEALLSEALGEIQATWPESDRIIYQNIEAYTPQWDLLPAPIMSVGGSTEAPFLELSNGLRVQVGSKLPSGYEIVRIDSVDGIGLMKQGHLVQLPIGI